MRRRRHPAGSARPGRLARAVLAAAAGIAALAAVVVVAPAASGVARLAIRLAATAHAPGPEADQAAAPGRLPSPVGGAVAVGALFTTASGGQGLGTHFCTASVVDSPAGDLVMTAAHCVNGRAPGQFVFVPGYQNGQAPYGVWPVTQVIVDQDWSTSADPDDDVAFLLVSKPGTISVQALTGGERLGIGQQPGQLVRVTGYPDSSAVPISCVNRADLFTSTQLEFDCGGFTDGTSGSPLLADISPSTGLGTVIGVIGGYQQGGDTDSVFYAARLEADVAALYKAATAQP